MAITSDFHLGLGDKERQLESYVNAKAALKLAIENRADLIVIAGDIFDESIPSQECLFEAVRLFSLTRNHEKSGKAKLVSGKRKGEEFSFKGIPVIAIFGTHEYRGSGMANVLDILQEAGFMLKLHGEAALFEGNGEKEKLCIFGMGGVPEKKALDVLHHLNPEPLPGAFNAFVMHQSIKEFLPFEDEMVATISLSDMPKGFCLLVNGHLHWKKLDKINDQIFLMPGSTIITQMKKIEADSRKGLFIFDTETKKADFFELPNQRRLFYIALKLKDASPEAINDMAKKEISEALKGSFPLKPLIRVKINGSLAKGVSSADIDLSAIEKEFSERAILSISKDFEVSEFRKRISELRQLQESRRSIKELALDILEKHLSEAKFGDAFDYEKMLSLLSEGNTEEALNMLTESAK